MKTTIKSIVAAALCAVGLSAFAEEPASNEIWYTATAKLAEIAGTGTTSGLHYEVFTDADGKTLTMKSHTWEEATGKGVITFDGGIATVGENAFRSCKVLSSITIPASVTNIGNSAFYMCCDIFNKTGLTTVTFAEGSQLGTIGGSAFSGCSALSSIVIPASVTSIGMQAFSSCPALESISVDAKNSVYSSPDNCNAIIETETNKLIQGCKNTVIPESVGIIGENAFYGISTLGSIAIPANVTSIEKKAFSGCSSLTTVTFAEGSKLGTIGVQAFLNCKVLSSITIPASVTSIGNSAFQSCEVLSSITIPASVTSIGNQAFQSCSNLTTVIFAEGSQLGTIGEMAFFKCIVLSSITIPASVTSIKIAAFANCSGIESVTVNWTAADKIVPINSNVFSNCSEGWTLLVPAGTESLYAAAPGWSTYKDKIVEAYLVSGVAEHGSVSFDKTCFPADSYTAPTETVTVTVTPDEGYQLKSLVWNDGTDHDITEAKSFTMPLKSVTVTAVFEEAPAGSEGNPWLVGTPNEADVKAWTNGTDTLIIEGSGAVGSMPWMECADGITELVKDKEVVGLDGIMATLPALTAVNGLTLGELASAGMVGAVKAGFSTIAVDPTTQEATLSVVISKTESLDEPEWKPVSTNDIPVKADTPAGFFIIAPQVPSDLDLSPIVTVK